MKHETILINGHFLQALFFSICILTMFMTSGCDDRIKIRQGDVEISIPRKDYEAAKAFNKKFWHIPHQDVTPHPVQLPDIKKIE
ncbi:MAG: hypothetical protein HGB36_11500 [Chlorobiaceae bacterium]|nr:hypothetical protein [Chlorobiaceae bacterium]